MFQTEITMHNQDKANFEDLIKPLRDSTFRRRWDEVIDMYVKYKEVCTTMINSRRGSALHMAVSDGEEEVVRDLVKAIYDHKEHETALKLKNEYGDTPLHLAATRGFTNMCKFIIGEKGEMKSLINVKNHKYETPLFLAALTSQTKTFVYLSEFCKQEIWWLDLINSDGDTILHYAIRREFFDLAVIIIHYYPQLSDVQNRKRYHPLKVLATRPSAFKSRTTLGFWKRILYHCITVEPLNVERETSSYLWIADEMNSLPLNYFTCYQFFSTLRVLAIQLLGLPKLIAGLGLESIRKMKQKHIWANQLLIKFMENPYVSYTGSAGKPVSLFSEEEDEGDKGMSNFYTVGIESKLVENQPAEENFDRDESVFFVAARNGIVEIVSKLQSSVSFAIHDTTSEKKNVLHVAVENRQPHVVEALRKQLKKEVWNNLIQAVDDKENTALHFAARGPVGKKVDKTKAWQVVGSAMQMMWDIKWYQYIKGLLPEHFSFRNNKKEKAEDIFKETHESLIEESEGWLKGTAESCSVVAALIVGVSFATSSTVPGGNQTTGKPALEGQPVFDAFAIASLIGLGFSATALIMFLSILTSRKEAKDFRIDLPCKLLIGLSSLFISIASMFVSFCAGHFFVLEHKYKHILFPLYIATCLPVSFYAIAQFPLYFDLLRTIFSKVPQPRGMGNNL